MAFAEDITMFTTLVADIGYVPLKSKIFHLRSSWWFTCRLSRKRYRKLLPVFRPCRLSRKRCRKLLPVFRLCHLNHKRCRKLREHLLLR
jgi:hypothetical protein